MEFAYQHVFIVIFVLLLSQSRPFLRKWTTLVETSIPFLKCLMIYFRNNALRLSFSVDWNNFEHQRCFLNKIFSDLNSGRSQMKWFLHLILVVHLRSVFLEINFCNIFNVMNYDFRVLKLCLEAFSDTQITNLTFLSCKTDA